MISSPQRQESQSLLIIAVAQLLFFILKASVPEMCHSVLLPGADVTICNKALKKPTEDPPAGA